MKKNKIIAGSSEMIFRKNRVKLKQREKKK